MCYLFNRCTRSISVVPAAMYAHLAAFRGRVLIRGGAPGQLRSAPICMSYACACASVAGFECTTGGRWQTAAAVLSSAGESDMGSVSSGGGGMVEFLPVHPNLSKV
jgi:hypothetical protein